jgi:signal transduction histidine kinase
MPLLDDTGKVRGVVSAFSDITERKQMERQRAEMLEREQAALPNSIAPVTSRTSSWRFSRTSCEHR